MSLSTPEFNCLKLSPNCSLIFTLKSRTTSDRVLTSAFEFVSAIFSAYLSNASVSLSMRSLLSARKSLAWLSRMQSSPPAIDWSSCTSKRARSSTVDPSCAPDAGTVASPKSATRILSVSAQNIPTTDDQNAVRIPPSRWGTLLRTLFGSKSSSPQAMPAKQKNIPSVVRIVGPSAVARRDHLMWNSRAIDDISTVENCVKPLRPSQMRSIVFLPRREIRAVRTNRSRTSALCGQAPGRTAGILRAVPCSTSHSSSDCDAFPAIGCSPDFLTRDHLEIPRSPSPASGQSIASRSTGRPRRFRATYPAPVLLHLPCRWPRVSGGASDTPPLPSCAAPGGAFPHVS